MKFILVIVLLSLHFFSVHVLAESAGSAPGSNVSEPETLADFEAELTRMGSECQAKLDAGSSLGRLLRTCVNICTSYAEQIGQIEDPDKALRHAKKGMLKCGNHYNYINDYEKKMKK